MEEKPTFNIEDYQAQVDQLKKAAQNNLIKLKDLDKLDLDVDIKVSICAELSKEGYAVEEEDDSEFAKSMISDIGAETADDSVKLYLKQIGQVALLSSDEETKLAVQMEDGKQAQAKIDEGGLSEADLKAKELYDRKCFERDDTYNYIIEQMQNAKTDEEYKEVARLFREMNGYKDSETLITACLDNAYNHVVEQTQNANRVADSLALIEK